ncbi:MAG: Gfo/Idh/MocA family oxidoreductase [Myxococcota bacterium]
MSAARVALVGARRARQGLGPFVARDLEAAGVEVRAVLGTRASSASNAADELARRFGIRARSYASLDHLLASEAIDALVILSPAETHERYLRAALEARLHVLCEKPLMWGAPDPALRARELVDGFRARGLLLEENCQWPQVLGAFRDLHPDWDGRPPESLWMLLAPVRRGADALRDSLPHPLSLLQALCPDPDPRLEEIRFETARGVPETLRVRFRYCVRGARVACNVELVADAHVPRPAALALDGRRAERRIRLPDYRMELSDGARVVPLPDPLTRHLAVFAGNLAGVLAGSAPPDPAPIARRLDMLAALVDAFPDERKDCAT